MTKQECSFNDAFLFLFQKWNNKEFTKTLNKITKECLNINNINNIKNYTYFKNNLLNSNIWATMYGENSSHESNDNDNKDEDKNVKETVSVVSGTTLFDEMASNMQSAMLEQEQLKLISLEKQYKQEFNSLKHSIRPWNLGQRNSISQNKLVNRYKNKQDFMNDNENNKRGIQAEKQINGLAIDFESGFYGSNEYDYKVYLTNLLILAHDINPVFQNECKSFFNDNNNISCKYTPAPVKTYGRCVVKSKLDYSNREWPHSAHILDYVRCSVVFDNINDFLNGFNKFYSKHDYREIDKRQGCIKGIVRIKNDFNELPNNLEKDLLLQDCGYRDIKCNVLIEHENTRLIGEIQFILSFMLNTKKKQHKIYALLRKKKLFDQLNELFYDKRKCEISEYLHLIIMNQNINKLSAFFQTMNKDELNYIMKNKKHILHLFQLSQFEKGEKLYQMVVNS